MKTIGDYSAKLKSFFIPDRVIATVEDGEQVSKNYAIGNDEAIVTVEDYTNYLFPEGSSWMETRDVLLIYIYQKLHEKNIKMVIAESEDNGNEDFVDDAE